MSNATVLTMPDGKVHLPVISNTEIATFRRCIREWFYTYILLRRPRRVDEALRFGTFWHLGQEVWWSTKGDASDKFSEAIHTMRDRAESSADDGNAFDLVKAEELMRGYTARWGAEDYETLGVEVPFTMPLVNPETGAASRTFQIGGKIDVIALHERKRKRGVEHKTTSSDIMPGSNYWVRVSAMDPQVSTYTPGARSLGYDIEDFVYDVVRKVALIPGKATPPEKRKYTQEKSKQCPFCKKTGNVDGPHRVGDDENGEPVFCKDGRIITEAGGRLHANQREEDETPEEFRERVRADISAKPEKYFARGPIVRLEHDEAEHAGDVWMTAAMMREAKNAKRYPRSPNACERYHRFCAFFDVCSGIARIEDDNRFRTATTPHEELAEV